MHEQNNSLKEETAVANIDRAPMLHIKIFLNKIAAMHWLKIWNNNMWTTFRYYKEKESLIYLWKSTNSLIFLSIIVWYKQHTECIKLKQSNCNEVSHLINAEFNEGMKSSSLLTQVRHLKSKSFRIGAGAAPNQYPWLLTEVISAVLFSGLNLDLKTLCLFR